MASTLEVGHAKNIANLNLLNTNIIALGATYNPSNSKLLLTNLQSETLNYERLKSLMRSDGFDIERESQANEKFSAQLPANLANGKTLIFKGPGKEAVATIYRDNNGQTAIVLNIITQMERFK